jgi:hypothetical protein
MHGAVSGVWFGSLSATSDNGSAGQTLRQDAVAKGICGEEWSLVRQAMEEITDHQPQDEFMIVETVKDRLT